MADNQNNQNLSASIKLLDIDLSPFAHAVAAGAKLPLEMEVTRPRPGALCEEIIAALAGRAERCDVECFFADHSLTMFKGGEQKIEYADSVAGHHVFIVLDFPSLDEKLVPPEFYTWANATLLNNYLHLAKQAAEAARGGGDAAQVHLIMPNHADARQDQRHGARGPVTVAIVAQELAAYFDTITCLHLHAPQTEGIYAALGKRLRHISPNEIHGADFVCRDPNSLESISPKDLNLDGAIQLFNRICVASPDVGGAKVARNLIKYSRKLAAAIICENKANAQYKEVLAALPDIPLVIVDKNRPAANVSEIMNVLGIEHAKGRDCTLFDDMGDGLGTLINAAEALIDAGAGSVEGRVSHGYFSGNAVELINQSRIKQVVTGNGMALRPSVLENPKIRVLNLGAAFAQVIIDTVTKPTSNITFSARHTHEPDFRQHAGRFAGPMMDQLKHA